MAKAKPAKPAKSTRPKKAKAGKAKPTARKGARKGKSRSRGTKARPAEADMAPASGEGELLVTLASEDELQEESPPVQELVQAHAPEPARLEQPLTTEWSLPEQFLTVALRDDWDDRDERVKVGGQGAAIAASLLLELAVRKRLRLHLDRYQVVGEPTGDPALDSFAAKVAEHADDKAQTAMQKVGRRATQHLSPWRGRLHRRGVAREERWRFLGIFPRSRTLVTDPAAKAKLENRLQRTLVGGTPDVRTILLLGLIDSAGLLPEIIPEGALAFNRKRINALLTGRDTLGYRVDPDIHDLQGALVARVLGDVRVLQGNRS